MSLDDFYREGHALFLKVKPYLASQEFELVQKGFLFSVPPPFRTKDCKHKLVLYSDKKINELIPVEITAQITAYWAKYENIAIGIASSEGETH